MPRARNQRDCTLASSTGLLASNRLWITETAIEQTRAETRAQLHGCGLTLGNIGRSPTLENTGAEAALVGWPQHGREPVVSSAARLGYSRLKSNAHVEY